MKKLLWLLPLSIVLYACPFESKVPLASGPIEPIDSSLLGYWYGIVKDGSDFFGVEALDISRQSDSVYSIIRYGKSIKGDMILPDTSYFSGYVSYIGEQRYMNIAGTVVIVNTRGKKPPEVITEKIYYLSTLDRYHDTLIIKTITDDFSTRKIYRNPEELKQAVIALISQQKNIYDDQYSLSYRKIPKPKPLKPL